jgi:ATP-dependent helicase Lhr and Lhr-like helicase
VSYLTVPALRSAVTAAQERPLAVPAINDEALPGLKFSTALPRSIAVEALGARLADPHGAATVPTPNASAASASPPS